jgi:hypothetical protein
MRRMLSMFAAVAMMAMLVVSTAFPAMAYHQPDCWAYDDYFGWVYWCDDVDYGPPVGVEEDCWEWSDVFEAFQWEC